MQNKTFSETQIITILREAEREESSIAELCRKYGVSDNTFYRWRKKYGGLDEDALRRLRELEAENSKLKRIVADQALAIDGLKEISSKKW